MNSKNKEIIAAIDIGSHSLKMKIAQINQNRDIKTIEDLRNPIPLGIDTFTNGFIRYESVREVCRILEGYRRVLQDYGVERYQVVATNAIREAKNKNFIVDQIQRKTGFSLKVLDASMARFLAYKAIRNNLENYAQIRQEGAFLLSIGAGSSEISVYKNNQLLFSQSIRIGSLRIREILSVLQKKTLDFYQVLEEYVTSVLDVFELGRQLDEVKHFIAIGGEIANISRVCNRNKPEKLNTIDKLDYLNLYQELVLRSVNRFSSPITGQPNSNRKYFFINNPEVDLVKTYHIPQDMVDLFLPSMIIYKRFLELSKADFIRLPLISFRDGILQNLLEKRFPISGPTYYREDIISSAWYLAHRYCCDIAHIKDVNDKALKLFDQLKKIHGLGPRERLLLEIAAILHDTGKYIGLV